MARTEKLNAFGEHSLYDVVTILRALRRGYPIPRDLGFPRAAASWDWPAEPEISKEFRSAPWHACCELGVFPVCRDSDGQITALTTLPHGHNPDWGRVAMLLSGMGCPERGRDISRTVVLKRFKRVPAFDSLDELIDLVDFFVTEGRELIGKYWVTRRPRSGFLATDFAPCEKAKVLTDYAMRLGTTEACVQILRALLRIGRNAELFDACVAGLFSLSGKTWPPLTPLVGLRRYFSSAATIANEATGMPPEVRQEVERHCEAVKTELQTITSSIEEQLSTAVDDYGHYVVFGFSRLVLGCLHRIRFRKEFGVTFVENDYATTEMTRRRNEHQQEMFKLYGHREWHKVPLTQFCKNPLKATGGKRPLAVIVGARCCFAQGALCEKGVGILLKSIDGPKVRDTSSKPGDVMGPTELVLVAGRYKFHRGHMEKRFAQKLADSPDSVHEFVPLARASCLVL